MSKKLPRVLAISGLLALAPVLAMAMGSHQPKDIDFEAANARIQPLAKVKLAPPAAASSVARGSRSGEDLYKAVCGACHTAGVAGAPKTGDKAAWAPRIAFGLAALTKTSITGKGAMPPKGGSDATDEELVRAIAFMANQAGANFKAPAAK
ncbi:MAG: c-type cytochrome [Rhodocyclaceae bacterium]|nr:c-type cytochrome [Rhodocyclaceae bacterium]